MFTCQFGFRYKSWIILFLLDHSIKFGLTVSHVTIQTTKLWNIPLLTALFYKGNENHNLIKVKAMRKFGFLPLDIHQFNKRFQNRLADNLCIWAQFHKACKHKKHRQILLSTSWLPANLSSVHCFDWCRTHSLLSIEMCSAVFTA